jgi:hypothetical protein
MRGLSLVVGFWRESVSRVWGRYGGRKYQGLAAAGGDMQQDRSVGQARGGWRLREEQFWWWTLGRTVEAKTAAAAPSEPRQPVEGWFVE